MSKILPAFIIFFSQTTQRGEGRRGRRRPFTCEGGRRRPRSPTICEVKTINTRHCWPIDMSENFEDIKLIDAEVSGNRLVTFLDEQDQEYRAFLETLDGIEFGKITFDEHEEFGASFLNSKENGDKIEAAGYSLMISSKISEK